MYDIKKKNFFHYFSQILTISPSELVSDKKRGRFQIPSLLPLD